MKVTVSQCFFGHSHEAKLPFVPVYSPGKFCMTCQWLGSFYQERICPPVGPSLQRSGREEEEGEEEEEEQEEEGDTALYSHGKLGYTTLLMYALELTVCGGNTVSSSPLEPTPLKQAASCCHFWH